MCFLQPLQKAFFVFGTFTCINSTHSKAGQPADQGPSVLPV
jgi:hypothetical protein